MKKEIAKKMVKALSDKKTKRYFISVDLNIAGIEAESEEEALKEAEQYIKDGSYSLNIVDVDED